MTARDASVYRCRQCGFASPKPGTCPDCKRATGELAPLVEEDPYYLGGVWTAYRSRRFAQFVEPWEMVPVVIDGSRKVTIVEGPTADHDMAQFALIEMRGAGRVHLGGFFEDGRTLALAKTADPHETIRWFVETSFWKPDALTARPLLHVL